MEVAFTCLKEKLPLEIKIEKYMLHDDSSNLQSKRILSFI